MSQKKSPLPGSSKATGTRAPSLEEARFRRSLESTALNRAMSRTQLEPIPAPSLEGLKVQVPALAPPSEDELHALLQAAVFERIPRKPKDVGTTLELGDEVSVDIIGYSGGALMPEIAQEEAVFFVEPDAFLPGFGQQLVGVKVGASVQVKVTLPGDYEVPALAGKEAVFAVKVREASELEPPEGEVEDPSFLKALGLPEKFEDTLEMLADDFVGLQQVEQQRWIMDRIMDQLIVRAPARITDANVDATLGALWTEHQDRFLVANKVAPQDREFAAKVWLENEDARASIRRRQHVWMILSAIALAQKFDHYRWEELEGFVRGMAESSGLGSAEELVQLLKTDSEFASQTGSQFIYLRTADYLLSKVQVETIPAGPEK